VGASPTSFDRLHWCRRRHRGDYPFECAGIGSAGLPITDAARLARIADTLVDKRTVERLNQVCERWIYSACLCFALEFEEQERTGFR
jgi:hypothetical protein